MRVSETEGYALLFLLNTMITIKLEQELKLCKLTAHQTIVTIYLPLLVTVAQPTGRGAQGARAPTETPSKFFYRL